VFCGRADHPHDTFAAHDFAVFTNSSDACSHLHGFTLNIRAPIGVPSGESAYVAEIYGIRKNANAQNTGVQGHRI